MLGAISPLVVSAFLIVQYRVFDTLFGVRRPPDALHAMSFYFLSGRFVDLSQIQRASAYHEC